MADRPGEASSVRPVRPLIAIAAAGLLAGLGAFGLGELAYGRFSPELVGQSLGRGQVFRPTLETKATADARNAAVAFGLLGGLLGLLLGLAGGLERRSIASAAKAGGIGLALGATAGAVLSLLEVAVYYRILAERSGDNLPLSFGLHATLWGPLGAVAGLAFGIGRGRLGWALVLAIGGLAGAVVGTLAYDALGAMADPMAGTGDAISATWPTRLLARLLVAVGTAVAIDLTIRATERPG